MRHSITLIVGLTLFFTTSSSAAIYKGRITYKEVCQSCHQKGDEIFASKTQEEWRRIMKDNGVGLAKLHFQSKKTMPSWEYFSSDVYAKNSRHLKDFLIEYAKDSGNVLACE